MYLSYQPICSWCVLPPLLPTQQVVVLPDSSPTATLRALVVIVSDVRPQDAGDHTPPTPFPAPFTDPRSAVCHDVTLYTFRPNLDLQGRRGGMGDRDRDSGVGWGRGDVRLRRHVWSLSPGRQMWPWSPLPAASSPLHPPPTSPDIPSCSPGPHAAGVADGPPRDTESQRD